MTPTERKRIQRARDKAAGWSEVVVRVAAEHAEALRAFAATLPDPKPPTDPRQLSMLEALDRQLSGKADVRAEPEQQLLGL